MNFILQNLDWLAGGSELLGSWLVGSKRKVGFLINMCCCLTWVFVAINREVYGLLLVVVPAFFINIRNYRRWRKIEPEALSAHLQAFATFNRYAELVKNLPYTRKNQK